MEAITAIGLTLNIVRLVELATQTGKYVNSVRKAPDSRARLAREAAGLLLLLTDLRHRLEDGGTSDDPWFHGIRSLVIQNGPLELFKQDLEALAHKLDPQAGWKKVGKLMVWPLNEKDISEVLLRIERLKSIITVALQQDSFELTLAIKQQSSDLGMSIASIHETLDDLHHDKQESSSERERRKVLAWLSPINFVYQQAEALSKRHSDTGNWFLRTRQFQEWIQGNGTMLWCYGFPGSGKTVIASIAIAYLEQHLAGQRDTSTGYMYLNHQRQGHQTINNLVGSLLQQLMQRKGRLVTNSLSEYYEEHSDGGRPPRLDEIFQLLQLEVEGLSRFFVVIDALDEADERVSFTLLKHLTRLGPKIRVMVTSRQVPIPEKGIQKASLLKVRARDPDLRLYLQERLQVPRMARHVEGDPDLKSTIVDTIVKKAQGMFLLAQLQMDSLEKMSNKRDVRNSVARLPETLVGVYNEAIARIRQQNEAQQRLANMVLLWISHAWRPLKVLELRSALATASGVQELDHEALPYEDDLVSVCAGLVYIEKKSGVIAFVHESAQQFFERFKLVLFPGADADIAITCLAYMGLIDWKTAFRMTGPEYTTVIVKYPLLQYATVFWARHALPDLNQALECLIIDFVKRKQSFYLLMSQITAVFDFLEPLNHIYDDTFEDQYYALILASSFGLDTVVKSILDEGMDPGNQIGSPIKPIHFAVAHGHIEIVRLLLSRGANVDARSSIVDSRPDSAVTPSRPLVIDRPIALAVKKGFTNIVKILLDSGARLLAEGEGTWCSILELAVLYQNEAIVQTLLEKNASTETTDYWGMTALSRAASIGNTAIVSLLLDHGAKIDARDLERMTVAHRAAESGVDAVLDVILQHSGEAGKQILLAEDDQLRTPLHYAANGTIATRIVLEGASIDHEDIYGDTPLLEAARAGRDDVVLTLIDLGANTQAKNKDNETVLTIVEASNSIDLLPKLLQTRVEKGINGSGRSPLHWAVVFAEIRLLRAIAAQGKDSIAPGASFPGYRHRNAAEVLTEIKKGCDINAKDNSGNTSLHLAIRRWLLVPQVERQSTKILLKKHANINVQDNAGRTPLHIAASAGFLKAVSLLLQFHADATIRDNDGSTALQLAEKNTRSPSAAQKLSMQGASNTETIYDIYSATSGYESLEDRGYEERDQEREAVIELLKR